MRQAHGVRSRRLDARLGHPRVDVALADAGHAAIGADDDDEAVLGRGGEAGVKVGRQEDVALESVILRGPDRSSGSGEIVFIGRT